MNFDSGCVSCGGDDVCKAESGNDDTGVGCRCSRAWAGETASSFGSVAVDSWFVSGEGRY